MKFPFSNLLLAVLVQGTYGDKATKAKESKLRAQYRQERKTAISQRPHQWEPRIVGGSDADEGDYPFFVQGSSCGASLIWKDIVLTAAHCKGYIQDNDGRVLVGAQAWNTEVREK